MELTRGQRINKARKDRHISVEKLAELTGRNKSYLYAIMRDDENPSIETLEAIAKAVGVPAGYFLGEAISFTEPEIFDKLPSNIQETLTNNTVKEAHVVLGELVSKLDIDKLLQEGVSDPALKMILMGHKMALERAKKD